MIPWRWIRQSQACLGLAVLAFAWGGAVANELDERNLPPGVTLVQAEGVVRLAKERHDLVMIDARNTTDRRMGYIEDSISLPDDQTNCNTLSVITANLDQPLLFYCNGASCVRSRRAIQKASDCGYRNLYWFKGGYEEWLKKRFPVIRAQ